MRRRAGIRRGAAAAGTLACLLGIVAGAAFAQQQPQPQQQAQPQQQQPPAQGAQTPPAPQVSLGQLPRLVTELGTREQRLRTERLQRFRERLEAQRVKTRAMVERRNRAEAETNRLDAEWNRNETTIADLNEALVLAQGNLGELFGVTRQVAGDAANSLSQSLITTQLKFAEGAEERSDFLRRLAGATELPDITELERLWSEMVGEMVGGGKVARYTAPVLDVAAAESFAAAEERAKDDDEGAEAEAPAVQSTATDRTVVRIGPFTAVTEGGEYLAYLPGAKRLTQLDGQLLGEFRDIGQEFFRSSGDDYVRAVVDPARGALLGLYIERPTWFQRIEQGEVVGWVIVGVGVLGVLVALFQALYLIVVRAAVGRQLRNLDKPTAGNPLGRVLIAFRGDGRQSDNPELAELRISEAVLREIPRLERFQAFLRLAVAAGPLLGLIGTVIGMIITFKAITASGSSDPKLMAQGIGQAMIATVLGLGIAIPLLFINAGLATLSRGVTQILDEQSHTLLAERTTARAA